MDALLVGRDHELAELHRLRHEAVAGRGTLALLVGEAGVGKSALLGRFLDEAGAVGAVTLLGRTAADEGTPASWPWLEVLDAAAVAGVPGLAPDLLLVGAEAAGADTAGARFAAMDRTARALLGAAARQPHGLVVALEDLHWADEATLQLLGHVGRHVASGHLLVVGTVRDGAAPPGLEAVWTDPAVRVLRPGPLRRTDVAVLLATRSAQPGGVGAGAGRDGPYVDLLHRRSGGNPLYLTELMRLPAGTAEVVDEGTSLPQRLRRLVAQRVRTTSTACRELLGACAAIGEEVDVALLVEVAGPTQEILAAVDEAVEAAILADDPDRPGRLRFSHDVVRMGCYAELDRSARLRWHRLLADALDRPGLPEHRVGELARHRCRSAVDGPSVRLAVQASVRAGRLAADSLALEESLRWWTTALELLDRLPADAAGATPTPADQPLVDRATLVLELAEASYRLGRIDDALELCRVVLADAETHDRAGLAAAAALVVRGIGGPSAAAVAELCERARALLGDTETAVHAQLLAQHAIVLSELGRVGEAEALAVRALALAERLDDPDALVDALWASHDTAHGPDVALRQLALGERLGGLAPAASRPDVAMWAALWRIEALLGLGDMQRLDVEEQRLVRLADELGWPLVRWHLLRLRVCRAIIAGRLDEASTQMRELLEVSRLIQGPAVFMAIALDAERARRLGEADVHAINDQGMPSIPIALAMFGLIDEEAGRADEAAEAFAQLRPQLGDLPQDGRWLPTVASGGELAARLGDAETAALCRELLRPYAPYYLNALAGVRGSVWRVLGVLSSAVGDHDEAVTELTEAVRAEGRIGALPDLARAEHDLAAALDRRGAPGDGAAALEHAAASLRLARRLGLTPLLSTAGQLVDRHSGVSAAAAGSLTPREREIVGLLAEGRSNREIAARLVLSERTVETHVRNVLAKLGLDNRTQVASWALRAGLAGHPAPGQRRGPAPVA